jgi:hypothetical protein
LFIHQREGTGARVHRHVFIHIHLHC